MKKKFHISIYKNSDNVHLKLFGDFDASSASELNRSLKNWSRNTRKVFVHTDALERIEPLSRKVLHDEIPAGNGNLIFTGKHASVLGSDYLAA